MASDVKEMTTEELNRVISQAREELRKRDIQENANKINKFHTLIKSQQSFINTLSSVQYVDFVQRFAPHHSTGACLDDSPHKDIVIGGCPCARCVIGHMKNGTIENTALRFGVITRDKF